MITGIETMARGRSYKETLLQRLRDPEEAAAYLDAALEEGDKDVFLLALRDVAEARLGGIGELAQQAGLNRESLYRTLSEQGNPELASLDKLLHALGLRLSVEVDPPLKRIHSQLNASDQRRRGFSRLPLDREVSPSPCLWPRYVIK
jgi:probable addiction module antidote protein